MLGAMDEIRRQFPHLFLQGCPTYILDLLTRINGIGEPDMHAYSPLPHKYGFV
jgi:hypothetical protein